MSVRFGASSAELEDVRGPSIGVEAVPTPPRTASSLSRLRRIRGALVLADALSLAAAVVSLRFLSSAEEAGAVGLLATLVIGMAIWVSVFRWFGLYRWNGLSRPSLVEELRGIVGASAIGTFLIVVAGTWLGAPTRTWLAGLWVIALVFELVTRWLVRVGVRREKSAGRLALRTLLVGTNDEARSLRGHLAAEGGWFTPVGTIAVPGYVRDLEGLPTVGDIGGLSDAIRRSRADCVFVAASAVSADDVLTISRVCRHEGVELRMSANVTDVLGSRLSIHAEEGVTAIAFRSARATRWQRASKRCIDLALGSALLLIALPLFAVIGVAIRLSSEGPVFFRQDRVTKDGKIFTIYKFRTMVDDVERALEGKVIDLTQPFFKMEDDPRLTQVGRFLRSFSLDELPQLWNVIRGDMSLVGPRPLPAEQVAANAEFLRPRHEVRAGLTGLWQISGRSDLESEDALRVDRFYIENWSPSLDTYILLKTATTVVTRRGAY